MVEDPIVAGYLRSVLLRQGYAVISLGACGAVQLLRSGDTGIGLLITNRPALFAEFAGRVPLLYLAASPDPEVASPFRVSRILRKPFPPDQFLSCVEQLLLPM